MARGLTAVPGIEPFLNATDQCAQRDAARGADPAFLMKARGQAVSGGAKTNPGSEVQ
ncbi:MAG: hypothetical protein HOK28_04085 [Deltaproteobacteria bacterium]|nr:hypothetical protein [Deltaproteobacteria bacterium]